MSINKLNQAMSWISMFTLLWLFLMKTVEIKVESIVIFFIFFVVAILSGMSELVAKDKSKPTKMTITKKD